MIVVGGEALMDLLVGPDGAVVARPGGGPFNTARTIARLGVPVSFLGRLSGDRFGRGMASLLHEDGVLLACPEPAPEPTTLALAEIDDGQARYRFYLAATAAPNLLPEHLAAARSAVPTAIHVGTLGLAVEPMASTLEAFVLGLPADVLVMIDPNCRPSIVADPGAFRARMQRLLQRADIVKASREDLAFLHPRVPADDAARALLGEPGAGSAAVLLTAGADPVLALTRVGERRVAVPPIEVVDTVGAGDAFGGAFLAWWTATGLGRAELDDLELVSQAVEAAVEVAAETCRRPGADPPHRADLGASRARWSNEFRAPGADPDR
jgi:fructokinase